MARYTFSTDFDYPARLHSVLNRPVENNGLFLLRLEFEVFQRFSENVIRSTGKVACRDLVVGKGLDATKDQGLWPYIQALGVPSPNNSQSWLNLHQARKPTWVQIQFAQPDPSDSRHPFGSLSPWAPDGFLVEEYRYELAQGWVSPDEAARSMRISPSTIRRRVAEQEPVFGERLVRRTPGGHRRINLHLLQNLS